jgi:hypothetical protein
MSTRPKGIHQRLDEIHTELLNVNFETILEGHGYLDAKAREKSRAAARRVLTLCDEHEKLDKAAT